MSDDLIWMSISELTEGYAARAFSPVEVTRAVLDNIAATNDRTNAFFFLDEDGALAEARQSEERWQAGEPRGPIDGIPYSLKDHIDKAGTPVTWGVAVKDETELGDTDGSVAVNLAAGGGVFLGKTTMSELGFYVGSPSLKYGPSRNPWNLEKTAGGSSGGAGAAVASGCGPIGIGSDGGGSIRIPAGYCGLVGFKPGAGRVPTYPAVAHNPVQGPLVRSVADAATAMNVLTLPDRKDYLALPYDARDYREALGEDIAGAKILKIEHMGWGHDTDDAVRDAVETATSVLARAGASIDRLDRLYESSVFDDFVGTMMPVYTDRFDQVSGGRIDTLLQPTQDAFAWSSALTVDEIRKATRAWNAAHAKFMALFDDYDFLISPTLTQTAFDADDIFPPDAPRNIYGYAYGMASFLHAANMAATPACSLPCGFDSDGLPIGFQVMGRRNDDFGVMAVSAAYEAGRGFAIDYPDLANARV